MKRLALVAFALACALPAAAQQPGKIYAQQLVDETVAEHPELITFVFHVTPPKSSQNVIIAANNPKRLGQKADPDDMEVITTGKPLIEVNDAGDRLEIQLRLLDSSKKTVGGLEMALPYKKGDDKQKGYKLAEKIRDGLAKKITSLGKLFEPAKG